MKFSELQNHPQKLNHRYRLEMQGDFFICNDLQRGRIAGKRNIKENPLQIQQALQYNAKRMSATPKAAEYIDSILYPSQKQETKKTEPLRCAAKTKAGRRCSNKAIKGVYCNIHGK